MPSWQPLLPFSPALNRDVQHPSPSSLPGSGIALPILVSFPLDLKPLILQKKLYHLCHYPKTHFICKGLWKIFAHLKPCSPHRFVPESSDQNLSRLLPDVLII